MYVMRKLNFGCGNRIASHWTNIDFHSSDSRVTRANLLAGFPFSDQYFDVVYSSHVLEHFTKEQARFLLAEAHRVLKPGGIIRTVVPDLEGTCREYLRILDLDNSDKKKSSMYEWVAIELLDQLVRSTPSGEMGDFVRAVQASGNTEMMAYVRSRTESAPWVDSPKSSLLDKFRKLTPEKLSTKMRYWHLVVVKTLIPKHLRPMVFVETSIGERHRWMYDRFSLKLLMQGIGFVNIRYPTFNDSAIPDFNQDCLDANSDGFPYKNNSIYCEAQRA
jgi:SAM-dependent methyltransferase